MNKKDSYIIEINWSELTGAECRRNIVGGCKKQNIEKNEGLN